MPKKLPQPRPEAPTELWRQADILIAAEGYTTADWRHHCRMEPVRLSQMARGLDKQREDGSTIRCGEVEVRVRDTGELVEVISAAAWAEREGNERWLA